MCANAASPLRVLVMAGLDSEDCKWKKIKNVSEKILYRTAPQKYIKVTKSSLASSLAGNDVQNDVQKLPLPKEEVTSFRAANNDHAPYVILLPSPGTEP